MNRICPCCGGNDVVISHIPEQDGSDDYIFDVVLLCKTCTEEWVEDMKREDATKETI